MSSAPGLFDDAPNLRKHFASIQEQFEFFHAQHPWIYRLLTQRAREMKLRGHREYSIKTLWEVMRWEVDTGTYAPGEFKLNNNFSSRYARMIMQHEPDLAEFFNTRELRA